MTEEKLPFDSRTVLGHPTGLFTLFFAEMWERFSYYGMRALLVFYMIKGFLRYDDAHSYAVYGAYTSLVYMTPFFGGMLADRLLGKRKAVILGGILMALGHWVMGIENAFAFYLALALLICGNGFFKPNISTIVGTLYPQGSRKSDGGFTIFYMGINLGAAMSPLLCGYIGETYGWHNGFRLATAGMITGLLVFVLPNILSWLFVVGSAGASAIALIIYRPEHWVPTGINIFTAIALVVAAVVGVVAILKGGLPRAAGAQKPPAGEATILGIRFLEWAVYLGVIPAVLVFAILVSGFAPFTEDGKPFNLLSESSVEKLAGSGGLGEVAATVAQQSSSPAGLVLMIAGGLAFGFLIFETFRLDKIARERMFVVLILTFFSMLFWSFFEQAGSSLNNFTDRNVDRVLESRVVTEADVGKTISIQPTQEQLGFTNGGNLFTLTDLDALRADNKAPDFQIDWVVSADNVGMGIAERNLEIPASTYQALNAIFILIFGLVFTALWAFLGKRGIEPSTPVKFSLGLFQLGLGFACFWYGAASADARGMSAMSWLALGYVFQTTGELCLSPVGLSMVVKLSPVRLVSTVMGSWFLASAFAQFLAAIIAQFTGVEGEEGAANVIPAPIETINIYGDVFGKIAIAAAICGAICLVLSPLLSKWQHEKQPMEGAEGKSAMH